MKMHITIKRKGFKAVGTIYRGKFTGTAKFGQDKEREVVDFPIMECIGTISEIGGTDKFKADCTAAQANRIYGAGK